MERGRKERKEMKESRKKEQKERRNEGKEGEKGRKKRREEGKKERGKEGISDGCLSMESDSRKPRRRTIQNGCPPEGLSECCRNDVKAGEGNLSSSGLNLGWK